MLPGPLRPSQDLIWLLRCIVSLQLPSHSLEESEWVNCFIEQIFRLSIIVIGIIVCPCCMRDIITALIFTFHSTL